MQSLHRYRQNSFHKQAASTSAPLVPRTLCCGSHRLAPPCAGPSSNGTGVWKFHYFDPDTLEAKEVTAKPSTSKSSHHLSSNGHGHGHSTNGHSGIGAPAASHSSGHSSTQLVHTREASKDHVQLQRLSTQLEEARSAVVKLQQFEMMYKESRMRSKQMQAEVTTLQQLLADKDAELSRQYRRMESEAAERSGLRTQFSGAVEEVRALRTELEEARQAVLELKGVLPPNVTLRRGLASTGGSGGGSGGGGGGGGAGAAAPSGPGSGLGGAGGSVSGAPGSGSTPGSAAAFAPAGAPGSGSGVPGTSGSGSGSRELLSSLQGLAHQMAEGMAAEAGGLGAAAPPGLGGGGGGRFRGGARREV